MFDIEVEDGADVRKLKLPFNKGGSIRLKYDMRAAYYSIVLQEILTKLLRGLSLIMMYQFGIWTRYIDKFGMCHVHLHVYFNLCMVGSRVYHAEC